MNHSPATSTERSHAHAANHNPRHSSLYSPSEDRYSGSTMSNSHLGLLTTNGGPTSTIALLPGSPASTTCLLLAVRTQTRVGLRDLPHATSARVTLTVQ